jgi:hypothetical protein
MPSMLSAQGYRRNATFDEGPRRPLTRREKGEIKDKIEIEGLQGRLTALHVRILRWIVDRVGYDGRCDPSEETIAQNTGSSVATVKRAKERAKELGLMAWTMRIIRVGARVLQRTCAYIFGQPEKPQDPPEMSVAQSERVPRIFDSHSFLLVPTAEQKAAEAALARRRAAIETRWLGKRNG